MAALSEQEEFEFRLRAEQEAKASPSAPAADPAAAGQRLLAQGVPLPPDAAGAPASPAPAKPPGWQGIGDFLKSGGPLPAIATAVRGGVGGAASTLGALGGLLKLDPAGGAEAGGAQAQRALDLVMGPQSEQSKHIAEAIQNSGIPLDAIPGMQGEASMMARGLGNARLPNMPKVPGLEGARGVIDKARGVPATAAAEDLRARSLATASESADRARQAAQSATAQATQAGLDAEHAAAWGAATQHHMDNVAKIGDEVEKQLLARPTMQREELGSMLRAAGTTLADEKIKARREAAGYEQAKAADGNKQVATDGVKRAIEAEKESLKNPNVRATLDRINKELAPGAEPPPGIVDANGNPMRPPAPPGMTLNQADSLRKYLNDAISEKSGTAMSAADRESQRALLAIKDAHEAAMEKTSPAWKQANENFAKASRGDLDYLTGKGDLAKTLERDSMSGQYKQSEAEVAGHIIGKANAGSDALSILVKRVPELKDASRQYFSGELFGKGIVPTPAVMDAFLKRNARSLQQLGLYDEFKDLASAQRARALTLKQIQGSVKEAGAAETNAGRQESAATSAAAKHQRVADRFTQFQTEIANVPAKQLPSHIKTLGKALQDDGLITQAQYGQMIRESDAAAAGFESAAARRALLIKIGTIAGLGVAGNEAVKHGLTP